MQSHAETHFERPIEQWDEATIVSKPGFIRLRERNDQLTVDSFSISSSEAPNEAKPISWENCAKLGSASSGMCPSSSWMQSLRGGWKERKVINIKIPF